MPLKAIIQFKNYRPKIEEGIGAFINTAVDKSTKVMERNIKSFTPVKHGTLRRSISSRMTGFGKGEVFTNPVVSQTSKGKTSHKEVSYAVYVEYGTRYMAPRAMFRKGVEYSEGAIVQIFKREAKDFKDSAAK